MDYFSCAGSPPSLCLGTDRLRPLGSVPPPGHLLHLFEDAVKIWPRYHNPWDIFLDGLPTPPTPLVTAGFVVCLPQQLGVTREQKSPSPHQVTGTAWRGSDAQLTCLLLQTPASAGAQTEAPRPLTTLGPGLPRTKPSSTAGTEGRAGRQGQGRLVLTTWAVPAQLPPCPCQDRP